MLRFAALATLVAFAVAQRAPTGGCDGARMQYCTNSLATLWSKQPSDMTNFWKDRHVFEAVVTSVYKTDVQDYVRVCNGISLFYHCIGRDNINGCLGVSGLTNIQTTAYDAYQFEGILARIRFECGDAFYGITTYNDATSCIQRTKTNYVSQISKVTDDYENAIQHDVYANACKNAQNFVYNISSIYNRGPCSEVSASVLQTASWFGCEGARQHVLQQYRHCEHDIHC